MAGSQIRRFLILHKELDADDGELTRTQKVRRGFIAERYGPLIEALYDGASGGRHRHRGDLRGRPQGQHQRRRVIAIWRPIRRPPPAPRAVAEEGRRRASPDEGAARSLAGEVLLSVENVSLSFGGVKALSDVSFDIRKGEIRAIIGPNGAGKTSMLNVINGFYHPQQGRITFKGETRARMRPYVAARRASPAPSRTSPCSRA